MIPTKVFHSIACCVAILSSFSISAQQKTEWDSTAIRFTVADMVGDHISFKSDGTIAHFPKDSLTAIKVMYEAMMMQFENKNKADKYVELYFYAAQILKYITKDGVVTDKKKFKEAVRQFQKREVQ